MQSPSRRPSISTAMCRPRSASMRSVASRASNPSSGRRRRASAISRMSRDIGHLAPMQFAVNLLTRSGRITYDSLRQRDPAFIGDVDRWFQTAAREANGETLPSPALVSPPAVFTPLRLRDMTLHNRAVFAPISTYDATDGLPNERHAATILSRAQRWRRTRHHGTRRGHGRRTDHAGGCRALRTRATRLRGQRLSQRFMRKRPPRSRCISIMPGGAVRHDRVRKGSTGRSATETGRSSPPPPSPTAAPIRRHARWSAPIWSMSARPSSRRHAGRRSRFRHAAPEHGARLPARQFPLAADEPARGRVRRPIGKPSALPARRLRCRPRRLARREAARRRPLRDRLGEGRQRARGCGRHRPHR